MKDYIIKQLINNYDYKKSFNKNEIIFNENEICDTISIVLDGEVKISSFTYNGNEIIFNRLKSNNMFGQSLLFSSLPYYKGKVIASKKSIIAFIKKDKLIKLLNSNNLYESFLNLISDDILSSKEEIRMLSFSNITDRLLYLLHIHKEIKYKSITELSFRLKVSREALSKCISKLVLRQIITNEGKCIKLIKNL